MADGTKGRPVPKPRALDAEAYCLSLTESGRWLIVDTSAPSLLGEHPELNGPRADVAQLGALAAMAQQATTRAGVALRVRMREHPGKTAEQVLDGEVIEFVGVSREEAAAMTGIRLASKIRR